MWWAPPLSKLFNNVVFKTSCMFLSKVIKRLVPVPDIQNYIDAALCVLDPAEEQKQKPLETLRQWEDVAQTKRKLQKFEASEEKEKIIDDMPIEQGKKKMLYTI